MGLFGKSETEISGSTEVITCPTGTDLNRMGALLIRKGYARKFQIDFLAELQKQYSEKSVFYRLGDLLVRHRVIAPSTLTEILTIQDEMPKESVTEILEQAENELSIQAAARLLSDH